MYQKLFNTRFTPYRDNNTKLCLDSVHFLSLFQSGEGNSNSSAVKQNGEGVKPGPTGNETKEPEAVKEEPDEEVDPLDQFMMEIDKAVKPKVHF